MATIGRPIPSEEEVISYMKSLSNWGRWGPDNQLGTLNLITPEKRAQAGRLMRNGLVVSCARPIEPDPAPDVAFPPLHYMSITGESAPATGGGASLDFIGMVFHGATITHMDSLCHMMWDGRMYNNQPAALVTAKQRAQVGGIDKASAGIVTRGVLLDITQLSGKEWLEAGEGVFPEDLEAAEAAQGVRITEGDALLVRLGWYPRRQKLGPIPLPAIHPGLHAATLPWLHERGVSIVAADAPNDVVPNPYPRLGLPLHRVGLVAMGLWLIDAANFEELRQVCDDLGRWEFLLAVAPLRFMNATGSPVNPLAIF